MLNLTFGNLIFNPTNQMYIVFCFRLSSTLNLLYFFKRRWGVWISSTKFVFLVSFTIFYGKFASVRVFFLSDILYAIPCLVVDFFPFLRTRNVYFYCYYSCVCILVLEKTSRVVFIVWFSYVSNEYWTFPIFVRLYMYVKNDDMSAF